MIRGAPKFDGVTLGEATVNFIAPSTTLQAKAAFVDSRTGQTHGWTTQTQWSPATMAALQQLRNAMEADIGRTHLVDGGEELITSGLRTAQAEAPIGGIAEALAPQV